MLLYHQRRVFLMALIYYTNFEKQAKIDVFKLISDLFNSQHYVVVLLSSYIGPILT